MLEAVSTPVLPPMGWYPDPADARRERYWDGQAWTHNVKDAPPSLRPARPVSPQPVAQPPSHGQPPSYGQPRSYGQPPSYGQPSSYGQTPSYGPVNWTPTYTATSIGRQDRTLDGVPLAGWWSRCLAFLIDQVLVWAVAVPLGWVFLHPMLSAFTQFWRESMDAASAGTSLSSAATQQFVDTVVSRSVGWNAVFYGVFIGYSMVMLRSRGATLGKLAAGLRVVPVDEGRARHVSLSQAFVRPAIAAAATILSPLNLIDVLLPLWTRKRQALHDLAARTQVIRAR